MKDVINALKSAISEIENAPVRSEKDKTLVVTKANGTFVRVFVGNAILRLHVYPNGHWNVQDKSMFGSKKVLAKGDLNIA